MVAREPGARPGSCCRWPVRPMPHYPWRRRKRRRPIEAGSNPARGQSIANRRSTHLYRRWKMNTRFERTVPLTELTSYSQWAQDMVADCEAAKQGVVRHEMWDLMREASL